METSAIQRVNGNLVYIQNPYKRPKPQEHLNTVDFNRAVLEFGRHLKFFEIKKSKEQEIYDALDIDQKGFLDTENGAQIPLEKMVIYNEGGKKYAMLNDGSVPVTQPVTQQQQSVMSVNTNVVNTPVVSSIKGFYFEIQIQEESGEPMLVFNFDNQTETTEKKLLKSFLLKAQKYGILIDVNNSVEITINNK